MIIQMKIKSFLRPALFSVVVSIFCVLFITYCHGSQIKNPLTTEEREWLKIHNGQIRFAAETNYPPLIFVNEKGVPSGISADYIRLIEQKLNFKFKKATTGKLNELITRISQGEVDVLTSLIETPQRSKIMLFTKPYIKIPTVIIVRKHIAQSLSLDLMKGMKVAVWEGTGVQSYIKENFPEINLVAFADDATSLRKLAFAEVDAVVADLTGASYSIEKDSISNLRIAGETGYNYQLCIGSRIDWPILNRILEKGLAQISPEQRREIFDKWIFFDTKVPLLDKKTLYSIIIFCGVVGIFFIFTTIWSRTLKNQVRLKTEELQKELLRRKETEEELRGNKNLFSNIIEFLPDATFVIDHNKNVIAWNRALETMTDTPKEEILGRGRYAYAVPFYGKRRPILIDLFEKENTDIESLYKYVEREQKTLIGEKYIQKLFKGKGAHVWGIASPFYDKNGNFSGAIESIRDISAQKKAEEELNEHRNHLEESIKKRTAELNKEITDRKQTEKQLQFEMGQRKQVEEQRKKLLEDLVHTNTELQDFAYVVSHDLKAPLRGISSIVQWLSEDYADSLDEKGMEYINKALLRTKRMHNLIEGILQYSRVGSIKTEPQQLDCKLIFKEIIEGINPPENITVSIEEPLPTIIYDETLLRQVVQNLIENAVTHLDKPEGAVIISCRTQGPNWEFCVKDNGVGIEERHHDRIFRIFQSLKPHSVDGSTGIGLSLVKKIMERNNGAIRLESAVDQGSSFFFTIPKLKPKTAKIGSTVLIVDDNLEFIEVATAMLLSRGFKIFSAHTGPKAFEIIEANPDIISFVLFDLDIPGEDTIERYKTMKRMRPELKIIICTGLNPKNNESLKHIDADGVLTKPFTISELNNILNNQHDRGSQQSLKNVKAAYKH